MCTSYTHLYFPANWFSYLLIDVQGKVGREYEMLENMLMQIGSLGGRLRARASGY